MVTPVLKISIDRENIPLQKEVSKYGVRAYGRDELVRSLRGERISYKERCLAKCYECSGYYADGKSDCLVRSCPLYPSMPYRGKL